MFLLRWCGRKGFLVHVESMLSKPVKYTRPCGMMEAACSNLPYSSCMCLSVCLGCVSQLLIALAYFSTLGLLRVTIHFLRFQMKPMYIVDLAKDWSFEVSSMSVMQ